MSFRVDLIRAIAISLWFAALAHAQTIPQDSQPDVLIGAEWDSGVVRLFSGSDGALLGAGVPFWPDLHGGVRVAAGDITGDGVADLITAQGMGGSRIRIVDGITAATLFNFEPFGPDYHGGLFVATGDLTGDGRADLLVGQGMGGLVKAYNSATMTELAAGAPFGPAYSGGVTVAAGDVNGDGQVDVIAGMAMGGLVRVFSGMSATELVSGFPYGPLFLGGVNVAAGDMSGDGRAEIVVAPRGGSDAIIIVNPATLAVTPFRPEVGQYGINIAVGDLDVDGRADLLTAALGIGRPLVRIFSGATGAELLSGQPFPENFRGGVTIATTASASGVAFTSPDTATFPVGAVGTFTITTSGRPYPIVQTGALPAGVTFTDHGDGTATLAGTPAVGTGAAYALVFRGGPGGAVTQAFTLLVTEPPTFTTTGTTATFVVGTAGSFTFTTAGYPPPAFTVSGALPTGVTFTDLGDGTATLAGTPAAGAGGTYPLTITAINGIGPDVDAAAATLSFTLTVTQAPTFTSAASTTFAAGTAGTFTITTAGVPAVTSLVRSGAALPSGVTFTDNGDGTATLAGTPAAGTGGAYALIFTADNGAGGSATQNFTLTVNEAPAITSAATVNFPIGAPGSFTVTTTGFPRPTIARAGAALPAGVTFVDNGDGTGTLSGTPAAGSGGAYAFTLTAANGIGTDAVQAFTLTVNSAPAFTSAAATTFTVGAAGTFSITTTGTPAVTSIVVGGTLPAGVAFTDNGNGTATLAGTPAAGTGGTHALTFTASNGVDVPAVQNFVLTVTEAPAITSAAAMTFPLGAVTTFTVTTTGFPAPALTLGGAALPSGVTFVDNGDGTGTLSGTPAAGTSGAYAITLTAANGIGTNAVQNATLTVDQSPGFTSVASTTFTVGTAGTFSVTTNGSPAVTAITLGGAALPAGVTFTDNADGTATLAGTPAAGTGGTYAITFTATNGVHTPVVQNFVLSVNQAPAISSAAATTFATGTAGTFTVTTTGFPAPAVAIGGTALPAGVTFVDNGNGTGTLAGTPAAGTGGTYAITFTPTNAAGTGVAQAFALTVNEGPAITSAATTTFTVGTPGAFTVTTSGSPTSALTVTGTLPSGVTFVDNGDGTGTLSGTPAAGTGGAHALTFTASNGIGTNGTQAFTLNVNAAPVITSAASATFSVGTLGSFTVTTSGFPPPTIALGGVALPAGLAFVDNGNGTATLTGTAAAGTGGTYAISFTATNTAGASAPQAFTLTVNQAPAITSANTASFTIGVAGTFTVTTTGFPTAGITRTGAALPGGVTFVDNGDGTGTLSGTPAAGTAAAYALTFTAANGVTPNAVQAFTLNVNQPPAITSAASASFTVGTPGTFTVTATGFPTPTVSQTGALPTGVTFTPATRVLAGTATQTGAFPLVFTATNAIPPDATQNFTLNVVCPAIAVSPATMPDGLFQQPYVGVTFAQTGSTGSTFTWSATGLPAGLTIASTTGIVSGTPTTTVLNGAVVVTMTDNFGCQGTRSTTITVRPTTDNESYLNGVGNTQYVVGATAPSTPHVFFNDNVKTGDNGPGTLSITFPATSPNGIVTEGATDGTFTYTPNVGFAGPTDTFTYTLTDGNGVTNTGTVTVNLSQLVWYVNSSGGNGDGRSHNPFNSLTSADTAASSAYVFVHSGGATTAGNLTLDAGQVLRGQGGAVPFTLNGMVILQGTAPTLTGTVTLANSSQVVAANFSPSGIPAMTASGTTAAIAIDTVTVTGGTNALSLTNATGAVTVTNSTFTNTSGAEVLINQGNANVTIGATISSNAGRSIDIQNRTGGIVTFSGPVTDTGQGIFLNANTGSTINFTGGLALTTTTNPAFTATGGGTVSATQNNTTIVNTITTTTGTALNVANTTIGASGLTFRSVSVNGASRGILLNTTGGLGGLTVTGNGGTCTPAAPTCTGGRVQNTAGADDSSATPVGTGIVLNSTQGVSLTRMRLDNHSNWAIRGTNVNGFVFDNGVVDGTNGTNDGFDEGAVSFTQLIGSAAVTNSSIGGAIEHNMQVLNSSGTLNRLTVSGTTFGAMDTTFGSDALLIESSGTAIMNVTVNANTFTSARGDHFQYSNTTAAQAGDVVFTNNTITNAHPAVVGGGGGIRVVGGNNSGQNGSITFNVSGNSIQGARGTALAVNKLGGTGTYSGTIANNIVGATGVQGSGSLEGSGIFVLSDGGGTYTASITGNTVRQYDNDGIFVQTGGSGVVGSGAMNVTVTGNTVTEPETQVSGALATNGFHLNGGTTVGDTYQICVQLSGNTLAGSGQDTIPPGSTFGDFRLRQRQSTTVRLPGYAGAATNDAAVVTFLQGQNTGSESGVASFNSPPGGGFVGGGACPVP